MLTESFKARPVFCDKQWDPKFPADMIADNAWRKYDMRMDQVRLEILQDFSFYIPVCEIIGETYPMVKPFPVPWFKFNPVNGDKTVIFKKFCTEFKYWWASVKIDVQDQ